MHSKENIAESADVENWSEAMGSPDGFRTSDWLESMPGYKNNSQRIQNLNMERTQVGRPVRKPQRSQERKKSDRVLGRVSYRRRWHNCGVWWLIRWRIQRRALDADWDPALWLTWKSHVVLPDEFYQRNNLREILATRAIMCTGLLRTYRLNSWQQRLISSKELQLSELSLGIWSPTLL